MNNSKCNILIAGVGGQGTLFASRVLGKYATLAGFDCKLSEVHGMSQRGGSVVTYVKFDDKVHSPLIELGEADVLLAFEMLEGARWIHYLKPDGVAIINNQQIPPLAVVMGKAEYPATLAEIFNDYNTFSINALDMAMEVGGVMFANTVMLGVLTKILNLNQELMNTAISQCVKQQYLDKNISAYMLGLTKTINI